MDLAPDDDWPFAEAPRPLGVVPDAGRGSLPFALLFGESLVACASWAMGDADVELVDFTTGWDDVRRSGRLLVVHDPLCPLTPASFLAEAAARAAAEGVVVVGVRPVTDTLKELDGDRVGHTHDRDTLRQVTSPVVLPTAVLAALEQEPDFDDLPAAAQRLAESHEVVWLEAPPSGARVASEDDLTVLAARAGVSDENGR